MGAILSAIKALIVPAVIALIIFLLLSFVLVPLWQRYQSRYSQYIPLDSIADRTSSLRQGVQGRLAQLLSPSNWRRDRDHVTVADDGYDAGYETEDGEELGNVLDDEGRRTELANRTNRPDLTRRLSRDLEQGFIDDSSSDSSESSGR